jgi:DNA-binding beta-propeller fold protein YncE
MKKGLLAVTIMSAVLAIGVCVAGAEDMPKLSGKAYVAGHGGHLAVLDLATGSLDRIVVGPAGGELAGQIAGLTLTGKKFCGAVPGPGGDVYYEDMADGNVYVFDPAKGKAADVIPVGKAVCGIGWDKGDNTAFVTDMVQGKVFVLDWKTKKIKKEIPDVGTFIHQGRMNPDRTEYWVTAANEFKVGAKGPEPYAAAGKGKMELVIIDVKKEAVKSRIDLTTQGAFPHDLAFTPDGKYALVTARTYGDDSIMMVIDTKTHEILGEKSLCKACHEPSGVQVTIDQSSPLLCGITVDWAAK